MLKQHNATFYRSVGHGVFDPDDAAQHKLLGRAPLLLLLWTPP